MLRMNWLIYLLAKIRIFQRICTSPELIFVNECYICTMINRVPLSIFLAALVLLLISSRDSFAARRHDYPLMPPEEIKHSLGVLKTSDLDAEHLSVTFWSADDAASRLENIKEALRAKNDPKLMHIGVNVGDDPRLAAAYLKRDALDGDSLQVLALPESNLKEQYGLRTLYR